MDLIRLAIWSAFGAILSGLTAPAAQAGPLEFGRVATTFSGRPAPPPSASACGLVLLAHDTGPQVLLAEHPAMYVAAVRRGEEVTIAVPVRGITGIYRVTAEVTLLTPACAEAGLGLGDNDGAGIVLRQGTTEISATATASAQATVIRLKSATTSEEAALRWRRIRLTAGGQSLDVPLATEAAEPGPGVPRTLPELRRPLEDALVDWDWRMQDGIETGRVPRSYAAAVRRTLDRGDLLIRAVGGAGVRLEAQVAQWRLLRDKYVELSATGSDPSRSWEELWRRVHCLRREIVLANPLARTGPLVFVKQVPGCFSHQLTQYYGSCAKPGGGLFVLEDPGKSMHCRHLAAGALPEGSYQHPEVSYEGDRVLFSYCHAETIPANREAHLDRFYHLYEVTVRGSGMRQLSEGPFDDFAPRYLPNGQILFISTRRGGFHRCGRGPCPVYTLALAEADGSHPHAISYHETHEWDPAVLNDGRIIYTRWDYVDRNAVHYQQLWSVRPDGSDVQIFYGNRTLNPVGVWEARAVPGSQRVMATAAAHHAMTAGSIILLDVTKGIDFLEPITRLTPDALFPESEAPVLQSAGRPGAWRAEGGAGGPRTVPEEAQRWPGHCYRSPYPLSEEYFLAAYSFDSLIGEPTWNSPNMFGIYLADRFGNKELLYRDLNIASLWPTPLRPRPRPPVVPSVVQEDGPRAGTFYLQDVYKSWPAVPRQSVKRLRIVQVLPKTTPHINAPTLGLANASPGKQVLGTVPVETDGSAFFRAPAGIALSFQALDERGQAVQIMRSVTYLQPGENAACIGCHESPGTTPPPGRRGLALDRPPSTLAPGPDGSCPLSYPILVQPVLDRRCVSCHKPGKAEGGVMLTGEIQGRYTVSYNALAPLVPYAAWGGKLGGGRTNNCEPTTTPGFFGARGCAIMQKILETRHEKVALSAEEIDRLATWMDANALFYGTFDPADQARQQRGRRIAGPAAE